MVASYYNSGIYLRKVWCFVDENFNLWLTLIKFNDIIELVAILWKITIKTWNIFVWTLNNFSKS